VCALFIHIKYRSFFRRLGLLTDLINHCRFDKSYCIFLDHSYRLYCSLLCSSYLPGFDKSYCIFLDHSYPGCTVSCFVAHTYLSWTNPIFLHHPYQGYAVAYFVAHTIVGWMNSFFLAHTYCTVPRL